MNWLRRKTVYRLFCVGIMGGLLAFCLASSASAEEASQAAPIVYQGQGGDRNIALTFDDGPHALHTAEILDILAEYGVHATFFVIGENADRYPELLEREISEGHEVGNHTQSHPLKNLPHEQMEAEISMQIL